MIMSSLTRRHAGRDDTPGATTGFDVYRIVNHFELLHLSADEVFVVSVFVAPLSTSPHSSTRLMDGDSERYWIGL